MKHLLLLLFCAASLEAQLFPGKAARIRSGSGAPAVGECVSADDTDRLWVDKSAIPTTAHICRQTSSGVFSWDVLEAAGGSLDGDLTAIAALSCSNTQIIVRAGGAWTCGTAPAATGSSLAQFASTTSLELAGVISNETGSGALVLGTAPTISSAVLTLPLVTTYVASGLPTAGTAGRLAILTDSTDGTCTTSGGSTRVWCFDTGSTWVSLTGAGGGSGSTAETYCVPSISSGNLLISTPCKVLVNNVELTFGSNMTCDASSGSGTILFGVQGTTAYCWHNVTLTATNATALGSTTAFPADACALASATVTSGTVSDPVNIRLGRACPVFTSSSTATASADPSTGALQVDLVLSGTSEEVAVSGGTVSLPSKVNLGGKTLEIPNGTTLPATCVVGEQFMDTDATSGSRHYLCESTNTWALQGGGGGGSVSETLVTLQQDMCGKTDALGQFSMLRVAGYAGSEAASTAAETNGRAGCGTKLSTTTSSTSFYAYSLANSAHWLTMQSGRAPKLWMKWRAVDTSSTNVIVRFQPAGATGAVATTESVGYVYSDATFGDSDIRFQVCVASSCTNTDTNVTMTAGVTYEGKVEQTGAAAWTWTIRSWTDEGSVTTTTGNVTSVNPPTEPIGPFALVLTGNTTAKSAVFHQFRAQYETN